MPAIRCRRNLRGHHDRATRLGERLQSGSQIRVDHYPAHQRDDAVAAQDARGRRVQRHIHRVAPAGRGHRFVGPRVAARREEGFVPRRLGEWRAGRRPMQPVVRVGDLEEVVNHVVA